MMPQIMDHIMDLDGEFEMLTFGQCLEGFPMPSGKGDDLQAKTKRRDLNVLVRSRVRLIDRLSTARTPPDTEDLGRDDRWHADIWGDDCILLGLQNEAVYPLLAARDAPEGERRAAELVAPPPSHAQAHYHARKRG